jgi:adenylylsulfate kinase-like enzyme
MSYFPERQEKEFVQTGMMVSAKKRTFAVHRRGGLVVWSGESHVGKTTTAEWLEAQIEARFDAENKKAFRAVHYDV